MGMRARITMGVCILALAITAAANPYDTISLRNSFNLAPPKREIPKPADMFKPPPNIEVRGIAAFGSHKWVLLSKADPGMPPRHLMMREGEKNSGLEIIDVDELDALVKIRADGTLLELTLATNHTTKPNVRVRNFVNQHTRAHELHQRREAARIARERAEFERLQAMRALLESQSRDANPAQQANFESE